MAASLTVGSACALAALTSVTLASRTSGSDTGSRLSWKECALSQRCWFYTRETASASATTGYRSITSTLGNKLPLLLSVKPLFHGRVHILAFTLSLPIDSRGCFLYS